MMKLGENTPKGESEKTAARDDLPELNRWLQRVQSQAKKKGYNIFAVAEDQSHPDGGASITLASGSGRKSAVRNARRAHVRWERHHGFDPHHDWSKTAARIDFPEDEHADLRERYDAGQSFFTTRISAERGKYETGQQLETPFGPAVVKNVTHHRGWKAHPHADELTPEWKKQLARRAADYVELVKTAGEGAEGRFSQDGHWRKLPPGHKGRGPQGQPQMGKTWVRRGTMRPKFKPMKHQRAFTAAAKQQLGQKGGGGIIAAHGTGTGKTFSAINAFEELQKAGKAKRALVITPAGLRANFLHKGIEKFTTSKGVILHKPEAVAANIEYVVVSYDAFRDNPDAWIDAVKPDTIIADEVHRAANPESKTYQALMHARQRVPRFMGLTASVVQNKPSEVVPLLALAAKGEQEIRTQRAFKKQHIEREKSPMRGIFGGALYQKKLVQQAMLKAKVGATIHYVEDLDSSKKPTKEVETVDVPMSSDQLQLYRMSMEGVDPVIRKKIAEGQPVSQKQAMNVFGRLMRARQVSNSLHLATPNMTPEQAAETTPKIKRILDDAQSHINETSDAQVVMYTNMVHGGVDVLTAGLKARGIPFGIFAGRGVEGVTEETRQQAVEDYLAGKNKVIVITGAGAEGLSLGNTTMVQLVDGHYNPERMAQAEARGVRAGGLSHRPPEERKVRVRRYVSTLPKTFWQAITFQQPEKSVGQWVYRTAGKKEELNKQLRDVLKRRSEHEQRKRESWMYRWFGGGP